MSLQAQNLLFSWLTLFAYCVVVSVGNISNVFSLFLAILFSLFIYLYLFNASRVKLIQLLFLASLFLPGLSIPLNLDNSFFVISDRLIVSNIVLIPISILILRRCSILNSRVLTGGLLLLGVTIAYQFSVGKVHSIMQVATEALMVMVVFVILHSGVRVTWLLRRDTPLVILLLLCIDLALSYSGVGEWSVSYRGGVQGFFFGHELSFSCFLLMTFIALKERFKGYHLRIYVILGTLFGFLIYYTNIKSTLFALLFVFLSDYLKGSKRLIIVFVVFAFFLVLIFLDNMGSVSSRFGTVTLYLHSFFTDYQIFGIAAGFSNFESMSNLAIHFFDNISESSIKLVGNGMSIFSELEIRLSYDDPDRFLPHNIFVALVVSYGLFGVFLLKKLISMAMSKSVNREVYSFAIGMTILMLLHTKSFLIPLAILISTNIRLYESSNTRRGPRHPAI